VPAISRNSIVYPQNRS